MMGEIKKSGQQVKQKPLSIHERYPFRWVDKREDNYRPITGSRGYPDPTADAAIANVMREEKRKRKRELLERLRKKQCEYEAVKALEKERRREQRREEKEQGEEDGDA